MPLPKQYRELFNLVEVEDILQLRIYRFGAKIADLFLVCPIPPDWNSLDYELETQHGRLKAFFLSDPDLKTNLLLHKSKFSYPTPGFLSSLRKAPLQSTEAHAEMLTEQEFQEAIKMEDVEEEQENVG
jgi:hypothetical protein